MTRKTAFPFLVLAAALTASSCGRSAETGLKIDSLGIEVGNDENREYSYTDKKSGFWYGRTHQDETEFWSGWNIAKKRILADYALLADGDTLDRDEASCTVFPDRLTRSWDNAEETFRLIDDMPVIYIELESPHSDSISVMLDKSLVQAAGSDEEGAFFIPAEAPDRFVFLTTAEKCGFRAGNDGITSPSEAGGFIITFGTREECVNLADTFRAGKDRLIAERRERINSLITEGNPFKSNLPELDKALDWITITMDELVTEQQGKGIYAGLPWFNEYWGRDMFISMPGACLVTGQFETAEQIIKDFIRLQDTDPESQTYGRIPNRANLEGILYNTTDGTPRLVIQAYELMKYSGDSTFIKDIYPAVKLSIDASIKNYTDSKGYLTHADADTWMDVKRNGIPGSPRGDRANDIQALWYEQLVAGCAMAEIMGDTLSLDTWSSKAAMLKDNFENDYCDKEGILIYDHLNADGKPDMQYRPNQLYCFDLVSDTLFKAKVTRRAWEELVYPWGVASLAQWDRQFHPQHENWHYYHKDDAYHNGTIWLWNNGIAMQRMLEFGQTGTAWKLFCNMNRQALYTGAVGSLSENADAHPREGKDHVKLSGTFLQAWSNAEHLRVWYQYFLGIRPDLTHKVITIDPHIPQELTDIETSVRIGDGTLRYSYHNCSLNVQYDGDAKIVVRGQENNGKYDEVFDGVGFCTPAPLDSYPCFATYYEEALTY